jgi:signal transduction histidine kinase
VSLSLEDPQLVSVVFEDNGPGLSPSLAAQIFDPFVTTKEGGTGLGLPLCRQILAGHGGSVSAQNREDSQRGAHFALSFPRVFQAADQVTAGERSEEPPALE